MNDGWTKSICLALFLSFFFFYILGSQTYPMGLEFFFISPYCE